MSGTTRSSLVDALITQGTQIGDDEKNGLLNDFADAVAVFAAKAENGSIDPFVVENATGALKTLAVSPSSAFTLPSGSTEPKLRPEQRRILDAVDKGQLQINPSTGLPIAPDEGAEVDNLLATLEKKTGIRRIVGDSDKDRLDRILKEIDNSAGSSDKLGEVAEALGLKKDADKADVVKTAKDVTDENEKFGDIAEALGLKKGATPDEIIAAAKAAKAGVPTKAPGRFGRGRG